MRTVSRAALSRTCHRQPTELTVLTSLAGRALRAHHGADHRGSQVAQRPPTPQHLQQHPSSFPTTKDNNCRCDADRLSSCLPTKRPSQGAHGGPAAADRTPSNTQRQHGQQRRAAPTTPPTNARRLLRDRTAATILEQHRGGSQPQERRGRRGWRHEHPLPPARRV